jgi:hypothetical protein
MTGKTGGAGWWSAACDSMCRSRQRQLKAIGRHNRQCKNSTRTGQSSRIGSPRDGTAAMTKAYLFTGLRASVI